MGDPIYLQKEITATGLLKSVASETQGAPNEIVAATASNGSTTGDYVPPTDSRLSDARTPTAHTHGQGDVTGLPAALDAKLTRQEAEDGFTEWVCEPAAVNGKAVIIRFDSPLWYPTNADDDDGIMKGSVSSESLTWEAFEWWGGVALTATRTRLRPTPEMEAAWSNKQDAITDLASIRSGAALGATAVQPAALDAALAEAAQFREWFPGGEAKSIADCTRGLKFDWANADNVNHTVEVLPFSNTGRPANDNSDFEGTVIIPPYVDHAGTRYTVVGVAEGDLRIANESLTAIVAPTTVTSIGEEAFAVCANLSSVSFPAVTNIVEYAFVQCSDLAAVSIPAATLVGAGAFTECDALATITLPAAASIGESAFAYCPNLATIALPSATSFADDVFTDCFALATVDFGPDDRTSVPALGEGVFAGLSGHTCRIIVPDGQFDAWTTDPDWAALASIGYEFVRWSDTQPAAKEYVDAGLAGKLNSSARNLLDYATGTTLSPATAVYRTAATLSGTAATIPTPDATAIPTAAAYYCFELEVSVDSTATSLTGPSGWTWLDGGELPTSGFAGATLYIACRMDCTARTFLASVWRVA